MYIMTINSYHLCIRTKTQIKKNHRFKKTWQCAFKYNYSCIYKINTCVASWFLQNNFSHLQGKSYQRFHVINAVF